MMSEKNNAICSICGKPYRLCISCKDMINLNPWKMHTDTSAHYTIYQILHGYSINVYSKDEAKAKLKKVDLSDFNSLRDNIKTLINKIMFDDISTNKIETNKIKTNKIAKNDTDKIKKENSDVTYVKNTYSENVIEAKVKDVSKNKTGNSKTSYKKKSFK